MNLVTLEKSDDEGELLLVNGGFCRFHIRKDRQLTIYEIYTLKNERGKGIGRKMLEELKTKDCDSIFARCPIDYESNSWYEHMGFVLEDVGEARTGKKLNHWRLIL